MLKDDVTLALSVISVENISKGDGHIVVHAPLHRAHSFTLISA